MTSASHDGTAELLPIRRARLTSAEPGSGSGDRLERPASCGAAKAGTTSDAAAGWSR